MRKLTTEEKTGLMKILPPQRKDWIQTEVFTEWKRQGGRGTYEGATGVGKTRVAVLAAVNALTRNPTAYVVTVVPTETLRDVDWPAEFKAAGAEWCLPLVKLMCYASVPKFKPKQDIDLLIIDEVHHFTEKTASVFNHAGIQIFDVLALTATLPKLKSSGSDKERRQLIDTYCPSIFKISLDEAVDLELVADYQLMLLKFPLDSREAYIRVVKKGKTEHHTEVTMYRHLSKTLQRAMMSGKKPFIFKATADRINFLRNLRSKERLARVVFDQIHTPGKRTLVFASSIAQAERMGKGNTYHSQRDDAALDSFVSGEIDNLWVVDALNEGKNLNNLDQSLIIRLGASERIAVQRGGRTVRWRPGHKGLIVTLVADGTVEVQWAAKALADFDPKRIVTYSNVKPE